MSRLSNLPGGCPTYCYMKSKCLWGCCYYNIQLCHRVFYRLKNISIEQMINIIVNSWKEISLWQNYSVAFKNYNNSHSLDVVQTKLKISFTLGMSSDFNHVTNWFFILINILEIVGIYHCNFLSIMSYKALLSLAPSLH